MERVAAARPQTPEETRTVLAIGCTAIAANVDSLVN
jgi:hypothetical protein